MCVLLCSPVRCVWWCSWAVNLPHTTSPPHPEYQLSLGWWCVWSNGCQSPGILSASLSPHGSTNRKTTNQHLLALTALFSCLHTFFSSKLYTQIQELHTKCKIPHIFCKMTHCIQNITNASQKQTFVLHCKHFCHNIIFLDISYTHTVIQNLFFHELLCTFLYKTESKQLKDWNQTFF